MGKGKGEGRLLAGGRRKAWRGCVVRSPFVIRSFVIGGFGWRMSIGLPDPLTGLQGVSCAVGTRRRSATKCRCPALRMGSSNGFLPADGGGGTAAPVHSRGPTCGTMPPGRRLQSPCAAGKRMGISNGFLPADGGGGECACLPACWIADPADNACPRAVGTRRRSATKCPCAVHKLPTSDLRLSTAGFGGLDRKDLHQHDPVRVKAGPQAQGAVRAGSLLCLGAL